MTAQKEAAEGDGPVPPFSDTGVNSPRRVHRSKGIQRGRHSRNMRAPEVITEPGMCAVCGWRRAEETWSLKPGRSARAFPSWIEVCDPCSTALHGWPNGAYRRGEPSDDP